MRRLLLCVLVACGCGDNSKPSVREDAGLPADAPPTGAAGRVKGCLDAPLVTAAPAGQLPCDLVPPGLQL